MKEKSIKEIVNNGLRKGASIGTLVLTLLCGCSHDSEKPAIKTQMGEDKVEIYSPTWRCPRLRILKKDGTEINFYDRGGNVHARAVNYVDEIEIQRPGKPREVYHNERGRLDDYDPLFREANAYWNRAYNVHNTDILKILEGDSIK